MIDRQSTIQQKFDRGASRYLRNPITHWVGRSELTAFRNMLPPIKKFGENPALDFGCGTGRVTALLLEMGFQVTGYDLSPRMLERARTSIGENLNARFTSDPNTLHDQWPVITALGVLDYYEDTAPLWKAWQQLIALDGTLLVTAPNAKSPLAQLYAFFSRFTCQAYLTTVERLIPVARTYGFSLQDSRVVFPQQRWGHTLVLRFQANPQ